MLLSQWHQDIIRIRPGIKTERGSDIPDWDNASVKTIEHCLFQPGSTILSQDGRVLGIQDGATVCAPVDADIKAGDRIQYKDEVYTIDGRPLLWRGVGKLEHMKLILQRWSG